MHFLADQRILVLLARGGERRGGWPPVIAGTQLLHGANIIE